METIPFDRDEVLSIISTLESGEPALHHLRWFEIVREHIDATSWSPRDLFRFLQQKYTETSLYINYPYVVDGRNVTVMSYTFDAMFHAYKKKDRVRMQTLSDIVHVLANSGAEVELCVDDGYGWFESPFSNAISMSSMGFLDLFLFCIKKERVNLTSWFPRYVVRPIKEKDYPVGRYVVTEISRNNPKIKTVSYPILMTWYFPGKEDEYMKLISEIMYHRFGIKDVKSLRELYTIHDYDAGRKKFLEYIENFMES